LAAGQQRAEITDGRGYELESEGNANDEHRSVDGGEQVAEHSSVDNSSVGARSDDGGEQVAEHSSVDNRSDGDSVNYPVCSVTFTAQEVATPDTCDHTFCAACLQELSQNKNN
jgi:PHD and RING finger domain-containing protein 1